MQFNESIRTQFNLVATKYDENRHKFIPCFDEYYIGSTNIIANEIGKAPKCVWDLGAGTGILTQFWYEHFPETHYVLVDIAEEMLAIAQERFKNCTNVEYRIMDYSTALPDRMEQEAPLNKNEKRPDVIISALSIHHLEHEQKKLLFKKIFHVLPDGGFFVNYDQFCLDDEKINANIDSYWTKGIFASGLPKTEIERWQSRKKLDRECSITKETGWLKEAGFTAAENIFRQGKFGVIITRK